MNPAGISLDTSVLLRLLVQEPRAQFGLAARFLEEQMEAGVPIHVSNLVLAEAYFALHNFYHLPKTDAILTLASFTQSSGILVTPVAQAVLALPNLGTTKPGFVDRLIHGDSQAAGRTLLTFEKAAKKLPATHILDPS